MQPFAGLADDIICEYPVEPKSLALALTREHLLPDANGQIRLPEAPGLGITPDFAAAQKYLVDVEVKVNGKLLYTTPKLTD